MHDPPRETEHEDGPRGDEKRPPHDVVELETVDAGRARLARRVAVVAAHRTSARALVAADARRVHDVDRGGPFVAGCAGRSLKALHAGVMALLAAHTRGGVGAVEKTTIGESASERTVPERRSPAVTKSSTRCTLSTRESSRSAAQRPVQALARWTSGRRLTWHRSGQTEAPQDDERNDDAVEQNKPQARHCWWILAPRRFRKFNH